MLPLPLLEMLLVGLCEGWGEGRSMAEEWRCIGDEVPDGREEFELCTEVVGEPNAKAPAAAAEAEEEEEETRRGRRGADAATPNPERWLQSDATLAAATAAEEGVGEGERAGVAEALVRRLDG